MEKATWRDCPWCEGEGRFDDGVGFIRCDGCRGSKGEFLTDEDYEQLLWEVENPEDRNAEARQLGFTALD